nr:hypothetical protein [Methanosarcina horonobensis]
MCRKRQLHMNSLLQINTSLVSLSNSLAVDRKLAGKHVNEGAAVILRIKMDDMPLFQAGPINCCIGVYLQGILKIPA